MEQHFRPSATDPGFDVVTENRFFFDREGTEWEELSFTLNGSKWGRTGRPSRCCSRRRSSPCPSTCG